MGLYLVNCFRTQNESAVSGVETEKLLLLKMIKYLVIILNKYVMIVKHTLLQPHGAAVFLKTVMKLLISLLKKTMIEP